MNRKLECLISEILDTIKLRTDLMNPKFPSIWLEEKREFEKNLLIGGFYREWSHDGIKNLVTASPDWLG